MMTEKLALQIAFNEVTVTAIEDIKLAYETLVNSESWHDGSGVIARAVDRLRDRILNESENIKDSTRE